MQLTEPKPQVSPGIQSGQLMLPYILYGAFVTACVAYGGLILSGLLELPPPSETLSNYSEAGAESWVSYTLVPCAVFAFGVGVFMGRFHDPSKETSPSAFLKKLQTKLIVQASCYEAIAIYGVVGTFLGVPLMGRLIYVAIGLLLLLSLMPGLQSNMDRLRALIREQPEV